MRFGNTATEFRQLMSMGLVIGGVVFLVGAGMIILVEKLPVERLIPLSSVLVLPASIMGLCAAPSLAFSIHINGGWVEHRLLDRWILSRARVSEFVSMKSLSGIFGAVLSFSDGAKIRFFGAHLAILSSLEKEIERLKGA